MKQDLSQADQEQLVSLLKKLKPGFLPLDIFIELARLTVLSIIEFVPLRLNKKGEAEILLLSRGSDDLIWPNELHVPGTVVRPTDNEGNIYLAFERILKDELNGTPVSTPHYVGSNLHKSKRGAEQAQIYWVEVVGEPVVGKFYPLDKLPVRVMQSQVNFIQLAGKNFLKIKQQNSYDS